MALITMDGTSNYGPLGVASSMSYRWDNTLAGSGVRVVPGRVAGRFGFRPDGFFDDPDQGEQRTLMRLRDTTVFPRVVGERRVLGFWFLPNVLQPFFYLSVPSVVSNPVALRFGASFGNFIQLSNPIISFNALSDLGSGFGYAAGVWQHIEIVMERTDTIGGSVLTCFLNGVQVTSFPMSEANANVGGVQIWGQQLSDVNLAFQSFSEFYFFSGSGAAPVQRVGPTASVATLRASSSVDVWSPSGAATCWEAVSSNPPGVSFIASPGVGVQQLFGFQSLPAGVTDVVVSQLLSQQRGTAGEAFSHVVNGAVIPQPVLTSGYVSSRTLISGLNVQGVNSLSAGVSS